MWSENHQLASNISMSRIVLRTFHAFFLHQWAAWAQPHVKSPDSPERGWLIVPQSLSSSPAKETLDYTLGSKCWIHTLPSRERANVQRPSLDKFCTPPSSFILRTLCFGNEIMHSPSLYHVWVGTKQQQSTLVFTVAKTNVNAHLASSNRSWCVYRDITVCEHRLLPNEALSGSLR